MRARKVSAGPRNRPTRDGSAARVRVSLFGMLLSFQMLPEREERR